MKLTLVLQLVFPLLIFWSGINSEQAFATGDTYSGNQIVSTTFMCIGMFALFAIARHLEEGQQMRSLHRKIRQARSMAVFLAHTLDAAEGQMVTVPPALEIARNKMPNFGYVYLLKEINGVHFKIGRARDPKDRLRTFNVKLPYQVEYICVIPTIDMYALERHLHGQYRSKRIKGTEWFALTDEDVASIVALARDAEG